MTSSSAHTLLVNFKVKLKQACHALLYTLSFMTMRRFYVFSAVSCFLMIYRFKLSKAVYNYIELRADWIFPKLAC